MSRGIPPLRLNNSNDVNDQVPLLNRWAEGVVTGVTELENKLAKTAKTAEEAAANSAPASATTIPPKVTGISVTENGYIIDGVLYSELTCAYTAPSDISAFSGIYIVLKNYRGSSQLVKVAEHQYTGLPSGSVNFKLTLQRTGETVTVYFLAKNKYGLSDSDWTTSPNTTVTLDGNASAPNAPTGVAANHEELGVWLSWNENVESNMKSYNVYRNTSNTTVGATNMGSCPSTGSGTASFFDKTADPGTAYYYWVTAINTALQESAYSASATATPLFVGMDLTQDSNSRYARTGGNSSYRPTTNPLTAVDDGGFPLITVADFVMRVAGHIDINVLGGSISCLPTEYQRVVYVYYDDINLAGGSVTFAYSLTKEDAINGAGRFFVGSIILPMTGTSTVGNNDGGTGAQYSKNMSLLPTQYVTTGTWTSPESALDIYTDTYAQGSASGTPSTYIAKGFPAYVNMFNDLSLQIKHQLTAITGVGAQALLDYSLDGGLTWTNKRTITAVDSTPVVTTINSSDGLYVTQDTSKIQVRLTLPGGTAIANVTDSTFGTVANVANAGAGESWTGTNPYTAGTGSGGSYTDYFRFTNWGFSIPVGATIKGIVIRYDRKGTHVINTDPDTGGVSRVIDYAVGLVRSGAAVGTPKAYGASWTTTRTSQSYGNDTDLWGTTWTPAQINASDFGFQVAAMFDGPDDTLATIYGTASITVYYDTGTGVISSTGRIHVIVEQASF